MLIGLRHWLGVFIAINLIILRIHVGWSILTSNRRRKDKRGSLKKKSFNKKASKKHKSKQEDDKSNQINAVFSLAEPAKTLNLKSPQFPASFGLVPYVNWKKHQSVAFSGWGDCICSNSRAELQKVVGQQSDDLFMSSCVSAIQRIVV